MALYAIKSNISCFDYERIIESMGESLVLFTIRMAAKRSTYHNHMFFENGKKPPLDIALHPEQARAGRWR